jgi:RNA polymerase sigma-70 factor (ECF subfamily)
VRRYTWNESDVEDILQEAFIRIFKSAKQYDKTKGSFTNWSKRIAINTAINEGKKRMRHRVIDHDVSVPIEPDVILKMGLDDLVQMLTAMPTDQYRVLNLHLVDGFSHKEIGEMLNITPDVSRQKLAKARRWIKMRFEMSGNDLVTKKGLLR